MPQGYCVITEIPVNSIITRLVPTEECEVIFKFVYFLGGEEVKKKTFNLLFKNSQYIGDRNPVYKICSQNFTKEMHCGYLELHVESQDGSNIFKSRQPFPNYAIFSNKKKKSFFMSFTNKVADPQIIDQIAAFKKFVMTYPALNINLDKNFTTTLLLINPYKRPIVVSFKTSDLRTIGRKKIMPYEAVYYSLSSILNHDESSWQGQVQLTANNRVAAIVVNHEKDDIESISNMEHLDPFRSDPTHQRLFEKIRNTIGRRFLKK